MDDEKHRRYTGVSNSVILENYKLLSSIGKDMVTRIPLIPGVNDTLDNIKETAIFMAQNGKQYVELLPYNKLAGGKYKLVGREYTPNFDVNAEVNAHVDVFEKYGIEVKIL